MFRSSLEDIAQFQSKSGWVYVCNVTKSNNFELNVVILGSEEIEHRLVVPCRLRIIDPICQGDVRKGLFGDIFFETGVLFIDQIGCSHELTEWEQPTRWFEG